MSSTASAPENDSHAATLATLASAVGEGALRVVRFRDNVRVYVEPAKLIDVLKTLRDRCGFALLSEVGGTDYLKYPEHIGPRFEVHYVLLNYDTAARLIVKTGVDDPDPTGPSAVPLWMGADWMEREVYDMFGIKFSGHPDLRRILMPDEFTSFPLRKDYPLRGRGERHNFRRLTRVES